MKKNKTFIAVILDKSGSMVSTWDETLSGFNSFIDEQKELDGECFVSLIQFDDRYEESYSLLNIKEVNHLNKETYRPRGWTKLYDAIGKTVNSVGEKLANMPENERPEKVLVCIITDGHENSSSEFTQKQIKEMVRHQTEKYNWQFVYMGANQDAVLEGNKIGILGGATMTYAANSIGTISAFKSMSKNMSDFRIGRKMSYEFEDSDRKEQEKASKADKLL